MQTEGMPPKAPNRLQVETDEDNLAGAPDGNSGFSILDVPQAPAVNSLFGLSIEQLTNICGKFATPAYRAKQLSDALYRGWIEHLDQLTTWPKELRERLIDAGYQVGRPKIVQTFRSKDGTERYLIAGEDEKTVETVWMPDGDDGESGDGSDAGVEELSTGEAEHHRATICISSQIGCAVNCQFCLTAKLGIQRNLSAGEIAGQVVAVLKLQGVKIGRDRINLVFMGMGEPFLNYDAFMDAVRLLVAEVGIAESRMTVSTSGIVPGILRFAAERIRPKLAISLNAPNDEVRERIMPVTRKWAIGDVIDAARQVPLRSKERLTFEYVLLRGVNDRQEQAEEVARLLRRANVPAKVNLIVWNPGPGVEFDKPEAGSVAAFQQQLIRSGIPTFVRKPRGLDIFAACGQLKRTVS
ncbi:Ribosomal RNA large subunit methyltransferase N [Acidisarcina polymorpha]|uniref:Probable dual-specificity RNA methyltransferase RlmN n=1 Tax=Acidisarcina polymorpha TaxID=2211140 RepID=A0A2Z5G7G6_9BACT|nr:23S rRNA (adenine(2503)-C(2))-methyltransferase RlmN [Acidisarcina polymorpha]AXC14757.1 Ribosomal RNA large subunit methyltransferase N [Acidisarcina polymorpha]